MFFLLKTDIHMQMLNTETFLSHFRGTERFEKQDEDLKQISSYYYWLIVASTARKGPKGGQLSLIALNWP